MAETAIDHGTVVVERTINLTAAHVFAAYADAGRRAAWGPPSYTAVHIYDLANFTIRGVDHFRCGSRDDPKFQGTTFYRDIVPDSRIVSSEVIALAGNGLSAALTTLELSPHDSGTTLKMTVQVTSFMGPDIFKGHEQGYNGALDNLVRHFGGMVA